MAAKRTEIFSVFGQIERVAAEIMIEDGRANKIERHMIPPEQMFNDDGTQAAFAVVVPGEHVAAFHKLIADLRA